MKRPTKVRLLIAYSLAAALLIFTIPAGQPRALAEPLTVPAGQSVVIPADEVREVDAVEVNGTLDVCGKLTYTGRFIVQPSGRVISSSGRGRVHHNIPLDYKFIGGESAQAESTDLGVWNYGRIEIKGEKKTPFVEMQPSEPFQDYQFGIKRALCSSFEKPADWSDDDSLVIIGPSGVVMPQAKQGDSVYAFKCGDKMIYPRVVNLTRSAGFSSGPGRSHVIVLHNGVLEVDNCEFRNLGPVGVKGRYPIHLHRATCDCPDGRGASSITNCSVWSDDSPSNRGIAIHDTHDHTIVGNIFCNIRGHAVFFEQPTGAEYGNIITDNITINVSGDSKGLEVVSHDDGAIYNATSHYWVRPGNTIARNLAVGGTAVGFVNMPGKYGSSITIDDCQAWGVGRYGFQSGTPIELNNPIAVNCDVAGWGSTEKWDLIDSGSEINSAIFLLNGENPDSPFITDTDRAYVSQVYTNNKSKGGNGSLRLNGGVFAGKKGVHVHYNTKVKFTKPKFVTDVLATPTYFESDILIDGGEIATKALADAPYPRGKSQHGRIRLKDLIYNGVGIDKTYISSAIRTDADLPALNFIIDNKAQKSIVEVANLPAAGYVKFPDGTKYLRYRPIGQPQPTWYPVSYTSPTFFDPADDWQGYGRGGMVPGKYTFELFDVNMKLLGVRDAEIVSGKLVDVK